MSGLKMIGFENQNYMKSSEKCLILEDYFLELSLQRKIKIFSQRMLNNIMRYDSLPFDYFMELLRRGSCTF